MMQQLPVEVVGPTLKDRSPMLSDQMTMNMYLGPGRDRRWAAYDFPGCKPFVERAGSDRGLYTFNEELYQVSGTKLLKIAESGAVTELGTVGGTSRCIFSDDGVNLVMASSGVVTSYDGTTVAQITNPNLETPQSVSYLNGVFLYDGDEGRFQASDVGEPGDINDLAVGIANSDGDLIIRGYAAGQLVWWMGPRALEPWYFSGVGELPLERLDQGIVKRGLGALYSVANNDTSMYLLGSDRQVYKVAQSAAIPVSSGAAKAIEGYTTISDAIGWIFIFDNQEFYCLTFPTESQTLLYSITYNYWVNLSAGMFGERHIANSYAKCYGKHYVADYRNGNVYEWDGEAYTDNGEIRLRYRDMAPITGEQARLPGRRIECGHLQINMEVGVGLATGQGVNPQIMCRLSGNGGKTFGPESLVSMGIMGDYDHRVDFYQFVDGYSIVARIGCSDPVYFSLFGGIAEIGDAGY